MGVDQSKHYLSDDLFYNYIYLYCGLGSIEPSSEFKESFYYKHIKARELIEDEKHDEAFALLSEILKDDGEIPSPVLCSVFSDLEKCCKERDDFRGAYEYSSNKIRLFEKMLSEV